MDMQAPQFNFLHDYIEKIIEESGAFDSLAEETRNEFIPQFVAEAERRIGIAVMPELNEVAAKEFTALLESEDTTAEQLQTFWQKYVPDLDKIVKITLEAFKKEFIETLSGLEQ